MSVGEQLFVTVEGTDYPVYTPVYEKETVYHGTPPAMQSSTYYSNSDFLGDPDWTTTRDGVFMRDSGVSRGLGMAYCISGGALGGCGMPSFPDKTTYTILPTYIPNQFGGTYKSKTIEGSSQSTMPRTEAFANLVIALQAGIEFADSDDLIYQIFLQQYAGNSFLACDTTNGSISPNTERAIVIAYNRDGQAHFLGSKPGWGPPVGDFTMSIERYEDSTLFVFSENKVKVTINGVSTEMNEEYFEANKYEWYSSLREVDGYVE